MYSNSFPSTKFTTVELQTVHFFITLPRLASLSPPISLTNTFNVCGDKQTPTSGPWTEVLPSVRHRKRIVQMLNNYHDNHLHPTRVWKCIPDIWHLVPMAPLSICIITSLPNFNAYFWEGNWGWYFLHCGVGMEGKTYHNSVCTLEPTQFVYYLQLFSFSIFNLSFFIGNS